MACGFALCFQEFDRVLVERSESICSEPVTVVRYNAIRKIAARIKHDQTSLRRRPIHGGRRAIDQSTYRLRNLAWPMLVAARQHPSQLAECGDRHSHNLCPLQSRLSGFALSGVVARDSSDQDVGIRRDLHRFPAQLSAMILFISSIESEGPPFRFRKSKASEILPVGLAAFTSTRPSGSFSTETFSPGRTPKCSSRSLRKVTWPFAVTVRVPTEILVSSQKCKAKEPYFQGVPEGEPCQSRLGLSFQVPATITSVIRPLMMAATGSVSTRAAVAAQ